jgi:predicted HicB family RNase H-like nuclease
VGRVLGLDSIVSFHGETVAELRQAFEAAINSFLVDCDKSEYFKKQL